MNIPVFLSRPEPFTDKQHDFIKKLKTVLKKKFFECHTLGASDYDPAEPLAAIRRLMAMSNGIITVAFGQTYLIEASYKMGSINVEKHNQESEIHNMWETSPYCHIETAMAFQSGLPILILVEKNVRATGILEKGVIGTYLPNFDLDNFEDYFRRDDTQQILKIWEAQVLHYYYNRGVLNN